MFILTFLKGLFDKNAKGERRIFASKLLHPTTECEYTQSNISTFCSVLHDIEKPAKVLGAWISIKPVECLIPFNWWWGYVRGRNSGWKITKDLTLVMADNDYGFTELFVLFKDGPALLLLSKGGSLSVTDIGNATGIIISASEWLPCNTVEEVEALPIHSRNAMRAIFNRAGEFEKLVDAPKRKLEHFHSGQTNG